MAKVPQPLVAAPRLVDWVSVDDQGGLVFHTGRVELGQGNRSAIVHMLADELDVFPDAIVLETARTDRSPNEGFTAGSLSITFGGQALRWVASALRSLLIEAAAEKLGAKAEDLTLKDGRITWQGKEKSVLLTELTPALSLEQDVVDHANPRPVKDRWRRNRDIGRLDLRERMVGAPFVHDMSAHGMLHGAPVHPPRMDAALISLDMDALKARPGVIDVVRDGSFVGVIANTQFNATQAADWARANGNWLADMRDTVDPFRDIAGSDADAVTIFEEGEPTPSEGQLYQTTVSRPYLFHGSIGPAAAVAQWDGDKVTVWTHSQGIFHLRSAIAIALGISEEKITVIHKDGAGCYGHNGADDAAFDAVLLAKAVQGRPVRVVWARIDEFRSAPMGPAMVTTVSARLGDVGRLLAMDVVVNSAPHANRPSVNGTPNLRAAAYISNPILQAQSTDLPMARGGGADRNAIPTYDIPSIKVQKRLVHELPHRTSSLRSLGAYTNVLAIESLIDDIVLDTGADPFEFRRRHLRDDRAIDVLDRLEANTGDLRAAPMPEGVGWGIAYARYKRISGHCAVFARVELEDEVRVTDIFCAADIGEVISPDGAINQIEGGIVQSISWTLKEEADLNGGGVATESWLDYPILQFSQVPRIEVDLIDRPAEPPLGVAEIALGPTAAAVSNAVRSALGVRVSRLPIARQSIIAALSDL